MLVLADTEPEWGAIPEAVTTHQADIVVTAGDLNETWLRRAQLTEVPVPTYGVYGNHCNGSYLDTLGVTNLHLNRVEVDGTSFVGLEGCVRYKRRGRDILYTQAEYAEMVADLPAADVLVTHCPPGRHQRSHRPGPCWHRGTMRLDRYQPPTARHPRAHLSRKPDTHLSIQPD